MQSTSLPAGEEAPGFSLRAIATKRTFRLADYYGKPVMLLFVDYNTGRSSRDVVVSVRRAYPDAGQLPIALVVDMRIVPRLLRGMAERVMEGAYQEAAAEVPDGHDPSDHLVLLPDWMGEVFRGYGIGDVSRNMHLVLIAPDGRIADAYQGPDPAQRAVSWARAYFAAD